MLSSQAVKLSAKAVHSEFDSTENIVSDSRFVGLIRSKKNSYHNILELMFRHFLTLLSHLLKAVAQNSILPIWKILCRFIYAE